MADLTQIPALVLERTKEGRLDWEPTVRENSFLASLGNQSLKITYMGEEPFGGQYSLVVLNKDGVELETIDAVAGTTEAEPLRNIFEFARRWALNVDEELDELVKVLSAR